MRASVLLRQQVLGTILSRDLFIRSARINSTEKTPYDGPKPSFYPPTVTDFDDHDIKLRNRHIIECLTRDRRFKHHLEMRTQKILEFLGEEFQLEFPELLCILCGVSTLSVDFTNKLRHVKASELRESETPKTTKQNDICPDEFKHVHIRHDRLRDLGERFFILQSNCSVVFLDTRYLLASQGELEHLLSSLEDRRSLIVNFMRQNGLYNCLIPYRGPTYGRRMKHEEYVKGMKQLRDDTSVASLFTLLGITTAQFGTEKVMNKLWIPKIMGSGSGMLKIITQKLSGG